MKDDLLAMVSHELRTPLTTVVGALRLLSDGPGLNPGERQEMLEMADRQARRLRVLIEQLLLAAQSDNGRATFLSTRDRAGRRRRRRPAARGGHRGPGRRLRRPGPVPLRPQPAGAPGPRPGPADPRQPGRQRLQVRAGGQRGAGCSASATGPTRSWPSRTRAPASRPGSASGSSSASPASSPAVASVSASTSPASWPGPRAATWSSPTPAPPPGPASSSACPCASRPPSSCRGRRGPGRPLGSSGGPPVRRLSGVEPGRGRAPAHAPGGRAEPARLDPLRAPVAEAGLEHGPDVAAALHGQAGGHELAAAAVLGGRARVDRAARVDHLQGLGGQPGPHRLQLGPVAADAGPPELPVALAGHGRRVGRAGPGGAAAGVGERPAAAAGLVLGEAPLVPARRRTGWSRRRRGRATPTGRGRPGRRGARCGPSRRPASPGRTAPSPSRRRPAPRPAAGRRRARTGRPPGGPRSSSGRARRRPAGRPGPGSGSGRPSASTSSRSPPAGSGRFTSKPHSTWMGEKRSTPGAQSK